MKERVIRNKTELAKLLMVCEAIERMKLPIPRVFGAEEDKFRLIYYGSTSLRQIKDEFEKKEVI